MKYLFLLYILLQAAPIYCAPPSLIIELTTWDPATTDKITQNSLTPEFTSRLDESFKSGKTLVEADQLGFYNGISERDIKFFSPNKFPSYALSYAHLEGILSKGKSKPYSIVENEIKEVKQRAVDSEGGISSLELHDRNLDNTFMIVDSSVLLESPLFDCSQKLLQIERNKNSLPLSVSKLCAAALEESDGEQIKIHELMDLYRNPNSEKKINGGKLEKCLEQFVFATYFANDVLIKLNAGELLTEIMTVIKKSEKIAKFYSYSIPSEMFLAVQTAIQKVAFSVHNRKELLADRFYYSTLKNFNKRIYIEVYPSANAGEGSNLKVIIQGAGNQVFFTLDVPSEKFNKEIKEFLIHDFNEFKGICSSGAAAAVNDLRPMLLDMGMLDKVNSNQGSFLFVLSGIGVVIAIIILKSQCSGKSSADEQDRAIEFRRIISNDANREAYSPGPEHDESM